MQYDRPNVNQQVRPGIVLGQPTSFSGLKYDRPNVNQQVRPGIVLRQPTSFSGLYRVILTVYRPIRLQEKPYSPPNY